MTYNWHWGIFFEASPDGLGTYLDMLLVGLRWTALTAGCAWLVALAFGTTIGVLRTARSRTITRLAACYVEVLRGIPLLAQLFLWYFVLPELLPPGAGTWLKQLPLASFVTAVVGLGLFMSARVAEQVRAGIQAVPRAQRAAAVALGLTPWQAYRFVLLPVAFRTILPPLTSEMLNTVKNTSVAFTIGLLELTAQTRSMAEFSFQVFEAFSAAAVLYLALNASLVVAARALERHVAAPGLIGGK